VLRRVGFGLLVTLVLALIALNVMAWVGGIVDEEAPPERTPTPASIAPTDVPADPPRNENEPIARKRPAKPPTRPSQPSTISLVLTANRGDCWVEVRAGSATGAILFSGTLANGRSLRFSRPKVWLRLGAASNVDIEINGRPSTIPPGTVDLVLPVA
jgi:hypothetical protein